MPRGIYVKDRTYRLTAKLREGLNALKYHDPDFVPSNEMTNSQIFEKLKAFGFTYRDGQWRMPKKGGNRSNGHVGTNMMQPSLPEHEVTIKAVSANRLEMCLADDQLDRMADVVNAMHTLGYKVDVKIVGTKQ